VTVPDTGLLPSSLEIPALSLMRNPIQPYDWGSDSALARLQSRTPSGRPEAELWMGAHPAGPSDLLGPDGHRIPLAAAIADNPLGILGGPTYQRFGARLPFVLKVLAIARPLSVQVHPDAARARALHGRPGSPYGDPFHKPELLCALEPVEALFGFRPADQAASLIGRLRAPRLIGLVGQLADAGRDDAVRLHAALSTLVSWPLTDRAGLVAEIASGSARLASTGNGDYPDAFGWVDRLIGLYPADPMVIAPLLLDLVRLAPGEAIFTPAGVPHCYLSGLGVEVLAASDNVVRCGLTSKPVAVEELLAVVDTRPLVSGMRQMVRLGPAEVAWAAGVEDFRLSRIRVGGAAVTADPGSAGPQIVLCTAGAVRIRAGGTQLRLGPGYSAFVTGTAGPLVLERLGPGPAPAEVFRATPGFPPTDVPATGSGRTRTTRRTA
jgi:mannose-6-phosphate isomerase